MRQHLDTVKDRVEQILRDYPETRESDKALMLKYLCVHHHLDEQLGEAAYSALEYLFLKANTPSYETIRRARQKFNEAGLYKGQNDEMKKIDLEPEWREWAKQPIVASRQQGFNLQF